MRRAVIVSAFSSGPAPRCFTAAQRVRTAAEYRANFSQGQRRFYGPLVVHQRQNGLQHARLGMAISKRALPHAVDRNRVKRSLREGFRHAAPSLPTVDLVISLSRRNTNYEAKNIRAALEQLCGDLNRD